MFAYTHKWRIRYLYAFILFWIFPNLVGQRIPKWPAKLKHPIDSYLRASVKTVRVVQERCGSWSKCSARLDTIPTTVATDKRLSNIKVSKNIKQHKYI